MVEALGAVEEDEIDRLGQIAPERLSGISLSDFDEIEQTASFEMLSCARDLRRFELGSDDPAAPVV